MWTCFNDTERKAMNNESYPELMQKGLNAIEQAHYVEALMLFERAHHKQDTPIARSYLAFCLAKVNHDYQRALSLCHEALHADPHVSDHYLNMGRIYLLVGKRSQALQTFKQGIKLGPNPVLLDKLKKFERRQPVVFSSLERSHPLNRLIGKLMSFVGLR